MRNLWVFLAVAMLPLVGIDLAEAQIPSLQPAELLQSTPFAGADAIDLCHIPGTSLLYVPDAFSGLTYVYDLTSLGAGAIGTIPNPGGAVATTGITSDGTFIYWAVPGAPQTLWRTDLQGMNAVALGALTLPAFGTPIGICLDAQSNIWANDVTHDQYSQHSIADGSALGGLLPHPDGQGSGGGIAFRSDCGLFEIPHGKVSDGQVTRVDTVLSPEGVAIAGIDIALLGPLVNGVEWVAQGSSGTPSLFLVEASSNLLLEIAALPPCPDSVIPEFADFVRCSEPAGPAITRCGLLTGPLPISNATSPASDTRTVTAGFPIGDLDLALILVHPQVGDLTITLTGPGGTSVTVFDGVGIGPNLLTTFDDEGAPHGSIPFNTSARMRPSGPGLLAAFNGIPFTGDWTLTVTDAVPLGNGSLNSWCMTASPPPGILIQPVGTPVSDTITITEGTNSIRDLNVTVEITHPFVGDLTVDVTGPLGTSVRLHDQSVVTGSGLFTTYDDDGFGNTPDGPGLLSDFNGTDPNGDWTIEAVDSFFSQVGTLDRWCLSIDEFTRREYCHIAPRAVVCVAPAAPISQVSPTVSTITSALSGVIRDLDVALDIQHTWIGDLDIDLASPTGTSVNLLAPGGGNIDDIHTTFDDEGSPFNPVALPGSAHLQPQGPGSLADFDNGTATGPWTLTVTDVNSGDNGVLESWCLDVLDPLPISFALGPRVVPIDVPDPYLVEEAELHIRIEHPFAHDIQMSLQTPQGSVVTLNTLGANPLSGIDVVFASDGIPYNPALLPDGVRMQPALGSLTRLIGEEMQGAWIVTIIDAVAGGDGLLTDCCLRLLGDESPCTAPTVSASSDLTSGPSPLTVQFSSSASGTPPFQFVWDFGDGTTALVPNPVHTYGAEGIYPVTLLVGNGCGLAQGSLQVQVCNPIAIGLTADVLSGPPPLAVQFGSGATGTAPIATSWNFGDGSTSSASAPLHVFSTAGLYAVQLTATNSCGLVQDQVLIEVCAPVTALPSATPSSGSPPLSVQFAAGATGTGPILYSWNFGDGTTSVQPNPTHTYAAGDFVASLTVTNTCGTSTHTLPITACAPVTIAPLAAPASGSVPLTVQFSAGGGGSGPIDYLWTFGDGGVSTEANPLHTYTTGGTFNATVSATNGCGSQQAAIIVNACTPASATPTGIPTAGASPLTVQFAANAVGTGPVGVLWTFGDGGLSIALNPTHTFTAEGTFQASVTVSNSCGSQTVTIPIVVCAGATVVPNASTTLGNAPLSIAFSSGATGTAPLTTLWTFGDGSTSLLSDPTHTYTIPGTYTVSVTANNSCGDATGQLTVQVCDPVGATPIAVALPTGPPTTFQFDANPTGSGPFSFLWDFGDGGTSTAPSPIHDFAPGAHTTTWTVSSPCGSVSGSLTIDICQTPTAAFGLLSETLGIAPHCVELTDLSTGEIAGWLWDFGDGTTEATPGSATHVFTQPGTYTIALTVTNSCGDGSTFTMPLVVEVVASGDVNSDGAYDITDPISLLAYIFASGTPPRCLRTADLNLDGNIDLGDAVYELLYLFGGGLPPQNPPACSGCSL